MTERILGMHFRYHTRICIFDGWRPPLHDPAMVIGMRLTGDKDPLDGMSLETRLQLYHEVYPSLPVKNHCACSKESKEYVYRFVRLPLRISRGQAKTLPLSEARTQAIVLK